MKILLITDIHYGENTVNGLGDDKNYVNSFGAAFENFLPTLQGIASKYDMLVNLGDLINENTPGDKIELYQKASGLLGNDIPIIHVIGNHDLNRISRQEMEPLIKQEHLYYSFDKNGYHHIVLDGLREHRGQPHKVDLQQIAWLREDLARTKLKTLVYCHFPLDEQDLEGNYYFKDIREKAFISNRAEVRSILEKSERVLAVFSGHTHFYDKTHINGIDYVTVPSFSENEKGDARAECLGVDIDGDRVTTELIKIK